MPPAAPTRSIGDEEWEQRKGLIKHLYLDLNKPLRGKPDSVSETLARQGFSASKSQYETIFKKWGFRKNRDAETWRTLLDDTGSSLKRKVEDIYDGQELIPAAKVRKAKTRYRLNTIQEFIRDLPDHLERDMLSASGDPVAGQMPSIITAPPLAITKSLTFSNEIQVAMTSGVQTSNLGGSNCSAIESGMIYFGASELPFIKLEAAIQKLAMPSKASAHLKVWPSEATAALDTEVSLKPKNMQSVTMASSALSTSNMQSKTSFAAPLPKPGLSFLARRKCILPSGVFPSQWSIPQSLICVEPIFGHPLPRTVMYSVANNFTGFGSFSMESVLVFLRQQTLFRLTGYLEAIKGPASDALAENLFKSSVEAGNETLVQALLRGGIDPDKIVIVLDNVRYTPLERSMKRHYSNLTSMLRLAAGNAERLYERTTDIWGRTRINIEVILVLLEVGSSQTKGWRWEEIILAAQLSLNSKSALKLVWAALRKRGFHSGVRTQEEIETGLQALGADYLESALQSWWFRRFRCLLDCAVGTVPDHGMAISYDYGMESTDLNSRNIFNHCGIFENMENPFLCHRCRLDANLLAQFESAVNCALKHADTSHLSQLLKIFGDANLSPSLLTRALASAIETDHTPVAVLLLDSEANLYGDESTECALDHAIRKRSRILVKKILDCHADVNFLARGYLSGKREQSTMELAVEWGDHDTLEDLATAGVDIPDVSSFLVTAIYRRDKWLLEFLLANADRRQYDASSAYNYTKPIWSYPRGYHQYPDNIWDLLSLARKNAPELFHIVYDGLKKLHSPGGMALCEQYVVYAAEKGDLNEAKFILAADFEVNGFMPISNSDKEYGGGVEMETLWVMRYGQLEVRILRL